MLHFRKVNSPEAFKKTVDFLTQDVVQHGGSASETVDMHGTLRDITVSSSPWGIIIINQEVSALEAWLKLFNIE